MIDTFHSKPLGIQQIDYREESIEFKLILHVVIKIKLITKSRFFKCTSYTMLITYDVIQLKIILNSVRYDVICVLELWVL